MRSIESIDQSLEQINRGYRKYSKKLASAIGVTIPQLKILFTLNRLGGEGSLAQISDHLCLSCGRVSMLLDTLEKNLLVSKRRCDLDRRKVFSKLTELGEKKLYHEPMPASFIANFYSLDEVEQIMLSSSMSKVASLMSDDLNELNG